MDQIWPAGNSLPLTEGSEDRVLYLNKTACEVRKPAF